MSGLKTRVAKLEERKNPRRNVGADIAEILRRRHPDEPRPPPPTAEEQAAYESEMAKTDLGRALLRRVKRVSDEAAPVK